ncbi:MAG: hypothetical protein N2Z21_07565 [Candidatus Sumerlaeaceae bacterium]|nr:hypothetical protein [Candidatus Sumerlaeaceae bacterium]
MHGNKVLVALLLTTRIAVGHADPILIVRTDIPSTASRVYVPLRLTVANENEVYPSSQQVESTPVGSEEDKALKIKNFSQKFCVGRGGKDRYVLYAREETELPWLGSRQRKLYYVEGWRIPERLSQSEKLFAGLIAQDSDTRIVVPRSPSKGSKLPPYHLVLTINLSRSGGESNQPRATAGLVSTLRVNGSTVVGESNVNIGINLLSDKAGEETTWNALVSSPYVEQPSSPVVPLNTNIESGGMLLAMEALATDFSGTTIAILRSAKLEPPAEITELPDFARVDLLRRVTVTRDKLLSAAQELPGIVFVLAQSMGPRSPYTYYPAAGSLSMDEQTVVDRLCESESQPPLVCFVTKQVASNILFEKYVDKQPSFYLLSDSSDASAVVVTTVSGVGYSCYMTTPASSSPITYLSRKLGMSGNEVAVLAFDRQGKLVFKRTTRSDALSDILYDARRALTK